MFDIAKKIRQNYILKKITDPDRVKFIPNINDVKKIGLMITIGEEGEWNIVYHFVKAMEKMGKKVNIIGYQKNGIEINYIITHAQTTICHENGDLNFWGVPKEGICDNFHNIGYDIFVDLSNENDFFYKYVALKTNSNFKITYQNTEAEDDYDILKNEIYDMSIRGEGPMDVKEYLNNIVNYLSIIQK